MNKINLTPRQKQAITDLFAGIVISSPALFMLSGSIMLQIIGSFYALSLGVAVFVLFFENRDLKRNGGRV